MENQENRVKSGRAFGPPKRNLPYFPKAIQSEKTMKIFTPRINNHPVLCVVVCESFAKSAFTASPPRIATKTKQRIITKEG